MKRAAKYATLGLLTALCRLFGVSAYAENADTRSRIFYPTFKTLKTQVEGQFLSAPVITLNGGDRILVSFDELADDFRYLQYSLVHCNADWQPSQLLESEYAGGFNVTNIEDYAFSTNTFRHYVNYRVVIPSESAQPLVSGNYLLRVYPENEPDSIILQSRFSVSEDLVGVRGDVTTITDRGANVGLQQLSLQIDLNRLKIGNPYSDILVEVTQNSRPDTRRTITTPLMVYPDRLVYDHNPDLIFPASNEFRRFETVRTDYAGMHVDKTFYHDDGYSALLTADSPRAASPYNFDSTQFGRFLIREYNATDSDLGADYINTVFTLDFPQVTNGQIYVDGEFTNHLYNDDTRMAFDPSTGLYTLPMILKQGSYNYQYVAVREGAETGTTALIEGDKSETRNEYTVKIFLRTPGCRADRLIGSAQIYSNI